MPAILSAPHLREVVLVAGRERGRDTRTGPEADRPWTGTTGAPRGQVLWGRQAETWGRPAETWGRLASHLQIKPHQAH